LNLDFTCVVSSMKLLLYI